MNRNYLIFSAMGLELVGIQISFIYIGHIIDEKMGWKGYALAGLSILGLVVWFTHIIRLLRRIERSEDRDLK